MRNCNYGGLLVLIAVLVSGAGCGPVYDTAYSFRPPPSGTGRVCVSQCETSRRQCGQLEDLRARQCEHDSQRQRVLCEAEVRIEKGREPKWYECGSELCSANYDLCESDYRSCYQACGGEVRAETRCVANCDKIPPAGSGASQSRPRRSAEPRRGSADDSY